MNKKAKSRQKNIVCKCLNISRTEIDKALEDGCLTLHQVLDRTGAGVGPCGGTCRPQIFKILQAYLQKKNTTEATNKGENKVGSDHKTEATDTLPPKGSPKNS